MAQGRAQRGKEDWRGDEREDGIDQAARQFGEHAHDHGIQGQAVQKLAEDNVLSM